MLQRAGFTRRMYVTGTNGIAMVEIGHVFEIVRYPVKSMAGIAAESAFLGWHGLDGDRRFAFRRLETNSSFPWLSASRLPELLRYQPGGLDDSSGEPLPAYVQTPAGEKLPIDSPALEREIADRLGSKVALMHLKHGIFDDAAISVISRATIAQIGRPMGVDLDRRRFRANFVLETSNSEPFLEDDWVGGTLTFGQHTPRPAVHVTKRDVRCMMINLDPDTGTQDALILKSVVRMNDNNAGVYGTVLQTGTIQVGQPVFLARE